MTKRRILLVSFLFPPNAGIGGLRVGKLAKFLSERGWDVRVLTCESGGTKDLPVEIPAEHIVRTPWFEVDHALDRFIPDWYRGSSAPANTAQASSAAAATAIDVGVPLRSTLRRIYTEIVRWPDSRIGWMPHAMREGRRLLDGWRPDFIYASAPPATCAVIADALSRRYRVPWIAEFRDLWTDNPYYDHSEKRRKLERVWERRVLGRAAALVTVSQPWKASLEHKFGKPTALVMNGYVLEDFPEKPPLPPSTEGPVQIVYTGGIYEGYRDPMPLFQAIAKLPPGEREQVRVDFVGASNETIRALAQRCGVEDRVTVGTPIPYREALRMQMRADILLHLQWNDPKEEGTISGKLFEYFAARRPVLGIGYDSGSVAQLLREHEAGAVRNEPDGIADLLRTWIAQKRAGGIPPLSDIAVAGLSRAEQFEKLERFLLDLRPAATTAKARLPARDMTGMSRTKHYRPIDTSNWHRPCLVALIDTEEDFDWRQPFSRENQSTASLANLNRAQEVFRRFGVVPTYLVDYPIVKNATEPELIGDWTRQGHCVVGAQLHPWVNPPHAETVGVHNSYAGNLPAELERSKLELLTNEIELRWGIRPTVYRAGRYGLGSNTARILEELGYLVDTSVIPYTNLANEGGPDYTFFGTAPFWFGQSRRLLGLPVTRDFDGVLRNLGPSIFPSLDRWQVTRAAVLGSLARMRAMERITLTPEGITLDELRRLTESQLRAGHRILSFSFHSPSLSPGNTPYVRDAHDLERFIGRIEQYLEYFFGVVGGVAATPLEIYRRLAAEAG